MSIQKPHNNKAMEVFIEATVSGDVGQAIENQERRGQQQLANSQRLPIEINSGKRQQLEAAGVVYHEPIDDLFVAVTLPDEWKIEPTDHHMWSHLLDEKGRVRASIFYKAAFYDLKAFLNVERRFSGGAQPTCGWKSPEFHQQWPNWVAVVTDADKEIWRSEVMGRDGEWVPFDKCRDIAEKWLDEHYPDWRDLSAYWSE